MDKIKDSFRSLAIEDRAGLYLTVIIHLVIIIGLLATQLGSMVMAETSFVLDFSKQDEIEELRRQEEFKAEVSKRLDDLINAAASQNAGQIRNIAVDANSKLRDDRGTDADQLYKDAERLQRELKSGSKQALEEDAREETVDLSKTKDHQSENDYKGPSVVSYSLDGRKASSLRIPAYKCMGGGDVTVIIVVDPQGNVINAKVLEDISSTDRCLRDYAVRAARLSKFSKLSPDKLKEQPSIARQTGEIVYRFIPQY